MSGGRSWTTGEARRLNEMRAQGLKTWAIAQELGRSENAIYSFIKSRRLTVPEGRSYAPVINEWTPADVHRLHSLASEGATAEEAAMELCRPMYAVRNKASREGVTFGKRSEHSPYRIEREGRRLKRDAVEGSAKLREALEATGVHP